MTAMTTQPHLPRQPNTEPVLTTQPPTQRQPKAERSFARLVQIQKA